MDLATETVRAFTRRHFFRTCGVGVGSMALQTLLARNGVARQEGAAPLAPKRPHRSPKVKNVIFLHMAGAPSQLELFDWKPELKKYDGNSEAGS